MTGLGSSCGACKFLRRKCTSGCIFAPYFCYDQAATHFAAVHKVFGASNASKLLLHLPVHNRSEAATTISYEALARVRDPIYGCVAHIFALQQQVANLQEEIEILEYQMANFTVGFPSCGSSETIDNQNSGLQICTQHDAISIQDHLYQQAPPLPQMENTTFNQASFDCQGNAQLPFFYRWEDQMIFPNSDSIPLDRLLEGMFHDSHSNPFEIQLEGMDQQIFPCYSL